MMQFWLVYLHIFTNHLSPLRPLVRVSRTEYSDELGASIRQLKETD